MPDQEDNVSPKAASKKPALSSIPGEAPAPQPQGPSSLSSRIQASASQLTRDILNPRTSAGASSSTATLAATVASSSKGGPSASSALLTSGISDGWASSSTSSKAPAAPSTAFAEPRPTSDFDHDAFAADTLPLASSTILTELPDRDSTTPRPLDSLRENWGIHDPPEENSVYVYKAPGTKLSPERRKLAEQWITDYYTLPQEVTYREFKESLQPPHPAIHQPHRLWDVQCAQSQDGADVVALLRYHDDRALDHDLDNALATQLDDSADVSADGLFPVTADGEAFMQQLQRELPGPEQEMQARPRDPDIATTAMNSHRAAAGLEGLQAEAELEHSARGADAEPVWLQVWAEAWAQALDSYTDDVWGPEDRSRVAEARRVVAEASRGPGGGEDWKRDAAAVRRLRMILGHVGLPSG